MALVQSKAVALEGNANASIAGTYVSALTEGNLMIAIAYVMLPAQAFDTPSGWTLDENIDLTTARLFVFHKTVGAAESETVTLTVTSPDTDKLGMILLEYSGADTGSPWDAATPTSVSSSAANGEVTIPAFTPSQDNSILIGISIFPNDTAANSPPTYATETFLNIIEARAAGGGPDRTISFGDRIQTTAAAEGTKVAWGTSTTAAVGWLHAIKPAAGGAPAISPGALMMAGI